MRKMRYENGLIHVAFSSKRMKAASNVWVLFLMNKHQYVWLFVLKLKGNCSAKPLILQLLFNQVRTTEMQMLMTSARDDLPQTYTLLLNNLCLPDETEHSCRIWSVCQSQLWGICSDTSQTERLLLRLKVSDTLLARANDRCADKTTIRSVQECQQLESGSPGGQTEVLMSVSSLIQSMPKVTVLKYTRHHTLFIFLMQITAFRAPGDHVTH